MTCEEATCGYRTRVITNLNKKFNPLCPACVKENILLREVSQLFTNHNCIKSKISNFIVDSFF